MEERFPVMRAQTRPRRGAALALVAAALLAGCATPEPKNAGTEWPMVPSTRVARPAPPAEAAVPAPPQEHASAEPTTDALVTSPVPPESSPLAELPNIFDRIRLGYKLPEVADRSIDGQVRFFAGKPDFLDRTFERAEHYLYYVVRELEARDMPLELAFLPVIESAYNPYAYSRARAAGIWQFIAPTARRYDVRVNWWQDGRRDIVDSTRAALDYLSELHTMFDGDWFLAIAAYNCGEAAVQRAVTKARRAGKPADFWHLKLPRETHGYVPALLAMARIVADPDKYGLEFATIANKPYFAQVEVGSQIDLRLAAMLLNVSEEELHELNPAFNRWATDPDGPHHLLVPNAVAPEFARTVASLSPELRMPVEHYRVLDGDSMQGLARDRDIPVTTIRQMNGIMTAELRSGDDIVLPASKVAPLRAGLIIEGETPLPGHHRHIYVVRRGETLASIARRNHVGVEELAQLNGLEPRSHLKAGNRLIVEVSDHKVRHRKKKANHPTADHALAAARKLSAVPGERTTRPVATGAFDRASRAAPVTRAADPHHFVS
jgi:membrane-bound lytic murein transglycosylase D